MYLAVRFLDLLFGKGDDDYPFWLLTVRLNILLFVACVGLVLAWNLAPARRRRLLAAPADVVAIVALTVLAALLRFFLASPNLMDFGGIAYSRLLYGYKGYFAAAQFFSLFYTLSNRDIEHAILLDQIAGTLTIPLVFGLCRYWARDSKHLPAVAAFLFAVYPLHILFSASDALAIFSTFLAASSYLLLANAANCDEAGTRQVHYLGGFAGLALLTQARYENVLLLLPPLWVVLRAKRLLHLRDLRRPLAVMAGFLAIYGYAALTSGLSYENPINVPASAQLVVWHVALNPFFSVPLLLASTLAVVGYRRLRLLALALLPWVGAFALAATTSQDGHGAARIYANWLILILPFAAYGLSLMLQSPSRSARLVAAAALLYFGIQPLLMHDILAARHLEILEHDVFKQLLTSLPPAVTTVIVPDDELMSRQPHSTLEVFRKYAMIFGGIRGAAAHIELLGLTDYLEHPQRAACEKGACVFFFGLPCTEDNVYPLTSEQCRQLLQTHGTQVIDEPTVVAAPFVNCSIYTGARRELLCDPVTRPRYFTVYRIDAAA